MPDRQPVPSSLRGAVTEHFGRLGKGRLAQLRSLQPTRMTEMWDRREQRLMDAVGETADLKAWRLENRVIDSVACVTLHQLLERRDLRQLDLLQIDAEGYDCEMLRTIDFTRVRPRFVNCERRIDARRRGRLPRANGVCRLRTFRLLSGHPLRAVG